jgi:hypothetical protein
MKKKEERGQTRFLALDQVHQVLRRKILSKSHYCIFFSTSSSFFPAEIEDLLLLFHQSIVVCYFLPKDPCRMSSLRHRVLARALYTVTRLLYSVTIKHLLKNLFFGAAHLLKAFYWYQWESAPFSLFPFGGPFFFKKKASNGWNQTTQLILSPLDKL